MDLNRKKVLITGAGGFIGSHLAERLLTHGCSVRALVQYNSKNEWGWLEENDAAKEMEIISGDVRDHYLCRRITEGVDIIFHLAALIGIPYSYAAPSSYVDTNVQGTLNICQAALENGCSRFVQTSTSEVYGSALYVPIDEKHPLQPQSPYSASKIAADMIALSHFFSSGLPVIVARPFNTFGPRQSARAVIPTIITQIASGAQEISVGDLLPTRDFNYVEDTCRGFIAVAEADGMVGQTVNIGSNSEISIGSTVEIIQRLMGSSVRIRTAEERLRPKASEVQRLWCDNDKIRRLTQWKPQVGFEQGLKRTIDWLMTPRYFAKYKPSIYNV